jgi:hypothetical protein
MQLARSQRFDEEAVPVAEDERSMLNPEQAPL